LPGPVVVKGFVKKEGIAPARDLLEQYALAAPDRFSYAFVDPDSDPAEAKKYGIDRYNRFVVERSDGKKEILDGLAESSLSDTLARLSDDRTPHIGFLTGHGERGLDDTGHQGYAKFKEALVAAGYRVSAVNLFEGGSIPEGLDALVIGGPSGDLTPGERELVGRWVGQGGALLVGLDPGNFVEMPKLFADKGVSLIYDLILDPVSQKLGLDPLVATATAYAKHPVVDRFTLATFFPLARSLTVTPVSGVTAVALATTSVDSWSETDIPSVEKGSPTFDESVDPPGPRTLAAALQWDRGAAPEERPIGATPEIARMIVVGDSDFAANNTIGLGGNRDLALNMVGWLVADEGRIMVRPHPKGFEPILFEESDLTLAMILFVILFPLTAVISGGVIWFRRNRR
ncbi:MAG: GldG family protein, partial [Nitrospinae bacterium]|nr:GldG family protein [Nitrospinota bacterium]